MGRYSDKNVVITGGSSGTGFAIAQLLSAGGARVAITGRSPHTLELARQQLGSAAMVVRGDVAAPDDLDDLADRVKGEFGAVDGLFVNAGIASLTSLGSTTEAAYDELFATNTKGAFFTVQKLAPLLSAGAGIVFTTSVAHTGGMVGTSGYAASKAALRSMVRSFSRELLADGVRVNAVSPGPIDTGVLEKEMTAQEAARFKAQRLADNPMGRFGSPDEVAEAAAFLAFDATYTTGAELPVDGGVTQL